jgi:hypothetical protein
MSLLDEIERERPKLRELCRSIGVPFLRVAMGSEQWSDVLFIGDIDTSRLEGYADRFFSLEEGLVRIFHRRIHLIEQEIFEQERDRLSAKDTARPIELLHAS